MLRVKNEARWISEVLQSIRPLCESIFVMDDHSTDNTVEICEAIPGVTVLRSPFDTFNEARDKNWLYQEIARLTGGQLHVTGVGGPPDVLRSIFSSLPPSCYEDRGGGVAVFKLWACGPDSPHWILAIDGDEVLEPNGPQIIRDCVTAATCSAYSLKIEYLWGDAHTVRSDRVYGEFWRPSLFKPFIPRPGVPDDITLLPEFRFMSTPFGRKKNGQQPNFHCSSVPQRLLHGHQRCPARLKHYGYMLREDRVRKLDFYTSLDWKNAAEDSYRHMVQGDSPTLDELPLTRELLSAGELKPRDVQYMLDVPPNAYLLHAGPIQLKPLDF